MTIPPRKSIILAAVVESYIQTGEPVGSKALLEMIDLSVSSATVRSEMASLAESGFLIQPHTSAGRIPSAMGYRYYVDKIMKPYELKSGEKELIARRLSNASDDPEHILKEAAAVLSEVSGYAAVSTTPPGENARIKRIHLVQTGRQTAMAVLITSSGMIKNRLFRCDYVLKPEIVSVFERLINEKFCDAAVNEITPAFLQSAAVSFGELAMLMPNVLMAVMESAKEASELNATLSGRANLLFLPDFLIEDVRGIMRVLGSKKDIVSILPPPQEGISVLIGDECNRSELSKCSVISGRYNIAGESAGAVAVIGPERMDYKKLVSLTEFICQTVGTMISELLEI
ncbi:MAG: heat-inducible transcriptional repressor HrcA [Acutalibacteraceae bacterium]